MHKQLLDKEKQRFYPLTDDKSLVNINTINNYQIECLFNPVVDDIIVTPSELTLADGQWGTVSVEISPSRARDVAAVTYNSDGEICGDSSTISVCWNEPGEHVLHVNELSEDITKLVKASVYKAPKLTAVPNIPSFGSVDSNRTYVSKNLSVYEVGVFLNDGCTFTQWSDGNTDLHRIIEIQDDFEITAILSCPDALINYTTNNNAIVLPSNDAFEVDIIDNTYYNEIGTLTFSGPIMSIGYAAFSECSSLTSITIPNSVTSIGELAFYECSSLTSITIPESVMSMGSHIFFGCSALTYVNIPDGVKAIEYYTFYNCSSLTSVTIGNSVTSIGNDAFYGCSSLTSVTIPNSVTSIEHRAFKGCRSLPSITIPNSVTSIGGEAFSGCSALTSIVVESGNSNYDSRENCNAIIETATNTLIAGCQNTIIPNSVTSIGNRAFLGCSSLTSITIPNSVTSIGYWAFYWCYSLTSVTIGNSVTSIGERAFGECGSLTSITCEAMEPPALGSYNYLSNVTAVYVPADSVERYKTAANWSNYANVIQPIQS